MRVGRAGKITATGALVLAAAAVPLSSILAEEGLRATLRLSQRLESVTETGITPPDKAGTRSLTTLDFGLTSETRNQTFALGLSSGLVYNFSNSDGFEIEDPIGRLSYTRENRNSLLSLSTTYRQSSIDTANFYDAVLDEDIVTGGGQRENLSVSTGLTLGREAPVTFTLNQTYSRTLYSETTAPGPSDSTRQQIDARTTFQISPVLTANLSAGWNKLDSASITGTDRTTRSLGFGGTYDVSGVLSLSAQLSYDDTTTTGPLGDSGGLGFNLGLRRDLTNGLVAADLSSTETVNGTRTEARITRSLDLQRGNVSLAFGATQTDGFALQPLIDLGLAYELSDTSQININLSQSAATSDTDAETVRTRLSASYSADINSLSSLSGALQLADQNALSDTGIDRISATASLTYRHDVGADWNLVSGYSQSYSKSDGATARTTGTLFLGLEKSFDVTP